MQNNNSFFRPNRLVFQGGPPEAAREAPKGLTAEQAQKLVNAAKGDHIELDATISKKIIEKRNKPDFKRWIKEIGKARERIVYARQKVFKKLLPLLPKAEQEWIGKSPLVLSRANWKEAGNSLAGSVRKLKVFHDIQEAGKKGNDYAYVSNLDRAVALVKGKPALEAGTLSSKLFQRSISFGKTPE